MLDRACFIDRDGIVNELVYYPDPGMVDSPFTPAQFALTEGIGKTLREMKGAGFKLVLISNQPSIGKGHLTMATFKRIQGKMRRLLAAEGVQLDGEYYCFHHPQAKVDKYRVECDCRKPKPGMLHTAARELGLSLEGSFMIGDGVTDVLAGRNAGCRTILVANLNGTLDDLLAKKRAKPDFVVGTVPEASDIIKSITSGSPKR